MVRISAIALDTLLELVGRQVIQELGEDGLSDIHPSLLTIGAASGHPALAPGSAAINFKSKNESYTLSRVICDRYSERPDFSRTLLGIYYRNLENCVITNNVLHEGATVSLFEGIPPGDVLVSNNPGSLLKIPPINS